MSGNVGFDAHSTWNAPEGGSASTTSAPERTAVPCHVCDSTRQEMYLEARGYRVAQCKDCGLWYMNPQPTVEELSRFYENYDDGDQWRGGEELFNRGVREVVLQYKRHGAILDVGCGSGNFLRCMRQAGFSVFGIEPSRTGSGYAQSAHGIETFQGMVEDYVATAPNRTFDVVTLLNVLEHLTHPRQTLLALRQLISPDGLLVVVVPDARFHALVGGIRRRLRFSDPYWLEQPASLLSGFKLPDHQCSFQPRTIRLLLERNGFAVISVQNAPVVFNSQSYRNLAKLLIRSMCQTVFHLTLRSVLFGYSTLVLARKFPGDGSLPVQSW